MNKVNKQVKRGSENLDEAIAVKQSREGALVCSLQTSGARFQHNVTAHQELSIFAKHHPPLATCHKPHHQLYQIPLFRLYQ